jgi:hypothetical protein
MESPASCGDTYSDVCTFTYESVVLSVDLAMTQRGYEHTV